MTQASNILSDTLKNDLLSGVLNPLLEVVQSDRDLNMEFRGQCANIYCKGYQIHLKSGGGHGYKISVHEKFWEEELPLTSQEDVVDFVKTKLPLIKQNMAMHCAYGHEIEFEQSFIRANNREPGVHTDYFAVDRQVLMGSSADRLDVLGIHWPDHLRDQDLGLALIEMKYGVSGGVEKIAGQVNRYYEGLKANVEFFANEAESILRQKLELGLIAAGESAGHHKAQKAASVEGSEAGKNRVGAGRFEPGCEASERW
jgi:hypothetical protein